MSIRDFFLALTVMVVWGLNFVAVKLGVSEIPPLMLTTLRFALIAVLVAPFFRLPRAALPGVALLSLTMGAMHFGLLFVAMRGVDAAAAAILIQLQVPFSALLAYLLYRERLGWKRALGMLLAFSGVVLLAGEPSRPAPWAIALILVSAAGFALSTVVIKRLGPLPPLTMVGWMSLIGVPQLFLLSAIFEHDQWETIADAGWKGWGAVVYTALAASILAHSLWYVLVRRLEMNVIVPFSLLAPTIGVFSGVLLLGEPFGWHKAVGGSLTLIGVAVIQLYGQRRHGA